MRIGMSAYRFNQQGGIERASYELARQLSAQGEDVTLLAEDVDPAPEQPLSWQRVTMPRVPGFLIPGVYPGRATRALRDHGFDILHNQGGCALRQQDVITAHSCHRAWWKMKLAHGEKARALLNPHHRVVLHMERLNYRPGAYSRVIAVSGGVGREVTAHYDVPADRIRVIPNAVDIARFQPADAAARRARVRAQHGIDRDDVVLLWVGKEFRRKGLAPLISALPHLPPHAKALVIGGDDRAPYQALAKRLGVGSRVIFAGHSSHVEDYFTGGDIFVFPTLYEAFALVTLEAAAAGLPLVTTRVNGTEDFVVEGQNGMFIERDSASIARTLRPLVDSAELRGRMADAARHAVAGYTWDAVARRTREVYEEVLAERTARPGR
ncbi:glycosyltransferase family 4 protein [Microbacterium kribbense]|uniref:Glycosyltransferase family 4 protein n=1 Tax=Microbacterium kribbense TaxID=433645 RepID=A0ABP7G3N6_9MICO